MFEVTAIYTNWEYTFWTPDGIGKIWYDDIAEAVEDSGYDKVIWLDDETMMEAVNA